MAFQRADLLADGRRADAELAPGGGKAAGAGGGLDGAERCKGRGGCMAGFRKLGLWSPGRIAVASPPVR